MDVVQAGALLHDSGRVVFGCPGHHITGAIYTAFTLLRFGFSWEFTKQVVHCVASHHGNSRIKPKTLEARIVADADALSHFTEQDYLIGLRRKDGEERYQAILWLRKKLRSDLENKLTIPEARAKASSYYKKLNGK